MSDNILVQQAEFLLLGAILDDNASYDKFVSDYGLKQFFFYSELPKICFGAIENLLSQKKIADVISVSRYIENLGYKDTEKVMNFLLSLVETSEKLSNYEYCIDILKSATIKREILIKTDEIKQLINSPSNKSLTPETILERVEKIFFELGELHKTKQNEQSSLSLAEQVETYLQEKQSNPDKFIGLSTSYGDLDKLIGGLNGGELIVIAARPSMGKTSLAMNIASKVAAAKDSVLLFSMEMNARDITMRVLSSLTRINLKKLLNADLYDSDWSNIRGNLNIIKNSNLFIDDSSSLTPIDIRSKAREIQRKYGLKLIVIDYLQLITGNKSDTENRNLEISAISRSLKALARELDIPVIVLSQLNRSLESRMNKRPILSDLRESGAIEQDADLVMAIYRDEVYNENSEQRGVAEIIVLKHRNGPIGTVRLQFQKEFATFEPLSYADESAFH